MAVVLPELRRRARSVRRDRPAQRGVHGRGREYADQRSVALDPTTASSERSAMARASSSDAPSGTATAE